ncbi:MAG TPA: S8 family serine peptidase [Salinimicrobium sp.]|nr:S8 family serine peptidase [Salinimicrobium sp.]
MKKIFFVLLLGVSFQALAQTESQRQAIIKNYDIEYLKSMASSLEKQFRSEQEKAIDYARANNIPIVVEKPNGGIAILQKITDEGVLIYYTTYNKGASITTKTNELYEGGDLNISIQGEEMIIGVWDGGGVLLTHQLLEGRVTQMDIPTTNSNHSTHVTGTLIGSEEPQNGNARGMAFEAEAWASDFNNDVSEMIELAAQGLLVSNHSYGYAAEDLPNFYFGAYDSKAAVIDEIAYNAPHYLIVSSAGNDRGEGYNAADNGYDLLTDQATSKNNLVVAAVHQVNEYTGPESVVMSSFSSFGPTDDGRIKPDISGKGVNVFSSIATNATSYATYSGTSMATPNVSGSLLLLQQLHNNLSGYFMKSSTLRGIAIHTASEAGATDGPDYQFGWGLLNMEAAARVLLERNFRTQVEENNLENEATYTKTVEASANEPLVVTIAWTDPAGEIQQSEDEDSNVKRLVNDLDLRVVDEEGNTFFPWKLNPVSFAAPAFNGDNDVDNVEKIEIANPSGIYTITVNHKGTLVNAAQEYALIISGVQVGDFIVTAENLATIVCDFEEASLEFNFLSADDYEGPTSFSVSGTPDSAVATFNPSSLTETGNFTLNITNLEGTPTGVYPITVTATGTNSTQEIVVDLTVVNASPLEDISVTFPEENAEEVFIYPTFTWTTSEGAQFYELEISTDPEFDSVFISIVTENISYSVPGLFPSTQYYWRIRPVNNCVEGNYVSGSFTTEALDCAAPKVATDTPVLIPSVAATVTSNIIIPAEQNLVVSDVNVTVEIVHTYVSDFDLFLVSPSGTQVILLENPCGSENDVEATFDDTGSVFECATTAPAISGIYQPVEPLNQFIGEDSAGEWILKLVDEYDGDGGLITNFQLEFCVSGELSVVDNQEISELKIFPNPANDLVNVTFPNAGNKILMEVFDLKGGKVLSKTYVNNSAFFNEKITTSGLSAGMYFIRITNDNQISIKKLMVR